jgi:hypothetical protein
MHNTGVNKGGKGYKNNPSKADFEKIKEYKNFYFRKIDQEYPRGGWFDF